MSTCTYVRKVPAGYEYGRVELRPKKVKGRGVASGTESLQEVPEYLPHGTKLTLDEALLANKMALKGKDRVGQNILPPFVWG